MERDNNLIHYRIQWAIALGAGILVTEGVLFSGLKAMQDNTLYYLIAGGSLLLTSVLSGIALFFCVESREGVRAALGQIDSLRSQYSRHKTISDKNLFEETYKLPRRFGAAAEHFLGHKAAKVFRV